MKKKTLTILLIISICLLIYPIISYAYTSFYYLQRLLENKNSQDLFGYELLIKTFFMHISFFIALILSFALLITFLILIVKGYFLFYADNIKKQLKIKKEKRKEKKKQKLEKKLKDLEELNDC